MGLFGKGKTEVKGNETSQMVKDPVCGMTVDSQKAAAKSEYTGKTYYFCNVSCKQAFDQNPAKYTGGSPTTHNSCCH